ncbi:hypothetical protein ACH5RR_008795 [Cinchona calisaya]|uniref:Uncharacterized protein n=1 Tax=Cinchona calisaya TaxID=153742 RepID=A0ABD3AHS2_9GENT
MANTFTVHLFPSQGDIRSCSPIKIRRAPRRQLLRYQTIWRQTQAKRLALPLAIRSGRVGFRQALEKMKKCLPDFDLDFDFFDLYDESTTTDLATKIGNKFRGPQTQDNLNSSVFRKDTSPEGEEIPIGIVVVHHTFIAGCLLNFLSKFALCIRNLVIAKSTGEFGVPFGSVWEDKSSSMSLILGFSSAEHTALDVQAIEMEGGCERFSFFGSRICPLNDKHDPNGALDKASTKSLWKIKQSGTVLLFCGRCFVIDQNLLAYRVCREALRIQSFVGCLFEKGCGSRKVTKITEVQVAETSRAPTSIGKTSSSVIPTTSSS